MTIGKKKIIIDFYGKSILEEVTTFFLYRFLSIGIGNRYSLMTDIGYYRLLSIFGLSINSEAYNLEANNLFQCCGF